MQHDIEDPSVDRGVPPWSRALATLCALAAFSCAPEDRAFTIDAASFTEAQRSTITRAGSAWDDMLTAPITFDGGDWRMVRGTPPPGFVAWTDAGARLVTIGDVKDDDLYRVVLHELGHSVGFFHHDAPGVMNPHANASTFTDADRAECPSVRRCR
jgi:hypothetical protein